jgi:alpha-beta hydrolase superfamily lysophospholipase
MASQALLADQLATRTWTPSTPTARGTVVLLPGRGETVELYERFGTRIAFDGYLVRALAGHSADEQSTALAELADATPGPVVVVGSDTGALEALVLAARQPAVVAGLVLAGTPDASGRTEAPGEAPAEWDDELDARSACPVHRERLATGVVRGALADSPGPAELARVAGAATPAVPVLVVHGETDRIAPVAGALSLAARLPSAETVVVVDGRHDALNDLSHRSVAAAIVQFLERLRSSTDAAPILRVSPAS